MLPAYGRSQNHTRFFHRAVGVVDFGRDSADAVDPGKKIIQDCREVALRIPSQSLQFLDSRNTVSIVAPPVLSRTNEADIRIKFLSNYFRIFENGGRLAAANVESLEIRIVCFQNTHICIHNIVNVDEISSLKPIFVNNQWIALEGSSDKDTADARILIEEGLARTLSDRITKRDARNSV